MKKLLFLLTIGLISGATMAQNADKKGEELVKFKETSHDFGKIKRGVPVTFDFAFTNISANQVIIETANASCGCTTPTWPKPPIAATKSDKITAGFNAAAPGPFNKSIYVKIAGVQIPVELKISGEVLSEEEFDKLKKG
jgi:hypothetical protein